MAGGESCLILGRSIYVLRHVCSKRGPGGGRWPMITATKDPTIALRPYQAEAIEAINLAETDGVTRPLVALPTGTGKTVVFAHLIDQRPGRALVLAHRDELIRQAEDKLLLVNPDFQIGVVKAGENEIDAPVVVASVQTLSRPNRLEQLVPDF